MTQNTIGRKRLRQKAAMRRASTRDGQQGRHRIGVFAACAAVAVGALVLAGAVSGFWSEAGVDRAEAARQAGPEARKAAQASTAEKVAVAGESAETAQPEMIKADATRAADDKDDSLSPNERIDRAVARITAGSTDDDVKKALKVAVREKAAGAGGRGDTFITAALPDSSAYAPAREHAGSSALGAIRDFDKSDEPGTASVEPQPRPAAAEEKPAPESKAPTEAAAAPTGPLAPATVSTDVHLRSRMSNSSAIVATVPARAAVQASQSCKNWCEVVYDGHHGYIYKSFIRRGAASATAASAASPPAAATTQSPGQETAKAGAETGILSQAGDPAALAAAAERAQQRRH